MFTLAQAGGWRVCLFNSLKHCIYLVTNISYYGQKKLGK